MDKNKLKPGYYATKQLAIRAAAGAAVALVLLTVFLWGIESNPAWPEWWKVRPFIIVPLAGAAGGTCFHILDRFFCESRIKKLLANILGIFIYIIGLWMGAVLGFVGTLWN